MFTANRIPKYIRLQHTGAVSEYLFDSITTERISVQSGWFRLLICKQYHDIVYSDKKALGSSDRPELHIARLKTIPMFHISENYP